MTPSRFWTSPLSEWFMSSSRGQPFFIWNLFRRARKRGSRCGTPTASTFTTRRTFRSWRRFRRKSQAAFSSPHAPTGSELEPCSSLTFRSVSSRTGKGPSRWSRSLTRRWRSARRDRMRRHPCSAGFAVAWDLSRIGAAVRPNSAGASTLAAMSVPEHDLPRVAGIVNAEAGVNHNYEREHAFNLWFVVTGRDQNSVQGALSRVRDASGYRVLDLPLKKPYFIDLGFSLNGNRRPQRRENSSACLPHRILTAADAGCCTRWREGCRWRRGPTCDSRTARRKRRRPHCGAWRALRQRRDLAV